jgi:hypothetical protein
METVSITFGGMEKIGRISDRGFTTHELENAAEKLFNTRGCKEWFMAINDTLQCGEKCWKCSKKYCMACKEEKLQRDTRNVWMCRESCVN